MTFCDEAGCPRYFFDKLMKLISQEVVDNQFDPAEKLPKRETLLRRLHKACPTPKPISVRIPLEKSYKPDGSILGRQESVDVHLYLFLDQLTDLLSDDHIFGNLSNLDVKADNRFGRFTRSDGLVNEVNSGSWYQNAYNHIISDPNNEFLMPLIFYVDKTGTDVLQRHGVEPLLFTTSVISWKQRQDVRAWRPLGFLPELYGKSSAEKESASNTVAGHGRSQRDYQHACLDKILESLKAIQKKGFIYRLRLGDQVKWVRIYVPVAFVINDGKSADMLCGRYGSYSGGKISRACDVDFQECNNTEHKCCYIRQAEMQSLQSLASTRPEEDWALSVPVSEANRKLAREKLKHMSCHVVRNAFHEICFGGDVRGVYGCTPTDLMHAFLEGVLKYCMMVVFSKLTVKNKATMDQIVDTVFRGQKNSVRKSYPRADFSHGITNLTLLTATEWGGVCFTLLLLTMVKSGEEVLGTAFYLDDADNNNDQASLRDLQELLEALLAFHAWTKCASAYNCSSEDAIDQIRNSVRQLLEMVQQRLPREVGNGWKLQKFHEIMHLPDDISRFGTPRNTDAGPGERSLKHFAKKPASTSQKRSEVFLGQVACRLHEVAMIAKAKRITDPLYEWTTDSPKFTADGDRDVDDYYGDNVSDDDDDDDHDADVGPVHSELAGRPRCEPGPPIRASRPQFLPGSRYQDAAQPPPPRDEGHSTLRAHRPAWAARPACTHRAHLH